MTPKDEGYDLRLSGSSLRAAKIVDLKAVASPCSKSERSCAEIIAYFSPEFLHKRGATRGRKLQSRGKRSRRRFPGDLNKELWPPREGLSHGVIRLSPNPVVVEDQPSGAFVEVVVGDPIILTPSRNRPHEILVGNFSEFLIIQGRR